MDETLRDKSRLLKSITVFVWVLCALAAVSVAFILNANKAVGVQSQNTITVEGKAERFVAPDIAVLDYTVQEDALTVKDAQAKATDKSNKVIDFLKKSGVDEKDIKTTNYNIQPKYEYYYAKPGVAVGAPEIICPASYCPPPYQQNSKIVGYTIYNSVEVKIRDLARAGDIVSGLGGYGVSNISSLSFQIEKDEQIREDVKNDAIKDARDKAKERAKSLGVRLGKIVQVSDNGGYPIYYAGAAKGIATPSVAMEAADTRAPSPQLPSGQNDIVSTVTLVYEIN